MQPNGTRTGLIVSAFARQCRGPYVLYSRSSVYFISPKASSIRSWYASETNGHPGPAGFAANFPACHACLGVHIRSTNYVGPTAEWCSKTRDWVVKPFEKCRTAGECSLFLRQELEKYEILQHQRQHRRRGRGKKRPDFHSDSDSDLSSTSADATSDEESLGARRRQQGRVMRGMEARMRELMERELEDWQQRREMYRPEDTRNGRKPGECLKNEFNHRLRQIKS